MPSVAGFLPDAEMLLRVTVATVGGLVLGLDRELRGLAAGIRTHALVSVSAAVTTLSAFIIYDDLAMRGHGGDADPLRVIQGLAQAIGFIAAGTIITARGSVHNLTSAANLWLAAALGIAAGAGQYAVAILALVFGVLILSGIRLIEPFIPGSDKARSEARERREAVPVTDGDQPHQKTQRSERARSDEA